MRLGEALAPLLPPGPAVVSLVGAGGKTRALHLLARHFAAQGRRVLVTTTTHMMHPHREDPPWRDRPVSLRPELEGPWQPGVALPPPADGGLALFAREVDPSGKVRGIHPSWVPALKATWDLVLVEADGSRRLPLKAPADHEPVLPPGTDLVVGCVGLSAVGRPLGPEVVHRPERFSALTGCPLGAPLTLDHLAALVRHPEGLFRHAPEARVILFNQADRLDPRLPRTPLLGLPARRTLLGSLEPEDALIDLEGSLPP